MAYGISVLRCLSRSSHRRLRVFMVIPVIIIVTYSTVAYINLQKSSQSFQHSVSSIYRWETGAFLSGDSKIVPEPVQSSPTHSLSDLDTMPRIMSCQKPAATELVVAKQEKIHGMTIKVCRRFCTVHGVAYGALYNGDSCYCMYQHGTSWLQKDSQCNTPCTGDNSTMCGGKDAWLFFKADELDGSRSWTIWMTYNNNPLATNTLRVRYRGCTGDRHAKRECVVERQAKIISVRSGVSDVQHYFIGCFTHQTWMEPNLEFVSSRLHKTNSDLECIEDCKYMDAYYAIYLFPGECVCTNSLGWSRPVDSCKNQFGALVFSTQSLEKEQLTLRFESRKTKKNIAVISHYRSGSSFASIMFSEYPGAIYVFEPATVFGIKYKDIVNMSLANEMERSKIFLERIYPLWFECRAMDLPGVWLYRYPGWNKRRNTGFDFFSQCKNITSTHGAPFLCSPYIEEKCLMAPIVAAKTTRMIHAENIKAFSKLRTNIEVIHAFRDPRGTLQSRARLDKWYRTNQTRHLEVACWELNQLRRVFEASDRPPSLHVLHYEDLATDVVSAATKLYRKMGLVMPEEIIEVLRRATGKAGAHRLNAWDTVQEHPMSRINHWIQTMNHSVVDVGDNSPSCQQFFKNYPGYYKPLKDMARDVLDESDV